MGKVSFKYGTASQLTNAPYSEGTFYVISDSGSTDGILYADLNNKRICFGDVASLEDDVSELSSSIPTKISELIDDSDFIKQYYGTCGTAAATVQKEVTINNITKLTTGLTIFVKFTYANTAADPTLKLNNFDTKYIKRYGTTAPSTSAASSWNAGGIVCLTYDGTYWYLNDWNNTTYSAMSESEMKTGTATTARNITAARLKQAIEYHAPVSSVNGQTGEVSINIPTVPTNVSDFTNDAGYLTSYTETDPVFSASTAAGITNTDISNWNNKSNTDEKLVTNAPIVDTTYYLILGSDTTDATTKYYDVNGLQYKWTSGVGSNPGGAELILGNNLSSGSNRRRGFLTIYGSGANWVQLQPPSVMSGNYGVVLPNKYGTIALTSDIPSVPTKVSDLTNDSGFISSYTETDPTVPSWAKQSSKPSYNFSEIDSKPTTINGYGITDAYTKTQVDGLVAGVLHYKGTKAAVSNLPTSGNTTGDTWHITADGSEWAWDGTTWQELGTAVDLSDYITTDDSRLSDARTPTAHNQALSTITGADDLKAIEGLTGTSGLLKKTAANTWTLDTSNYLTSYTETDPVFSASAAADISNTDINNWNKRSNLWTVSSDHSGDNYYWTLAISQNNLWNLANAPGSKGGIGYITLPVNRNGNIYSNVQLQLPITNGTIALTSDIPDTSSFLTSETDPVFSASAAAEITSTDISNWNAKVSDDKTWNEVTLNKGNWSGTDITYVPHTSSMSSTNAYYIKAANSPTQSAIAKYDNSAYLKSTTPSANDNSTKVATTAYVDAAIPDTSSFVNKSGDTMSGRLTLADSSSSTNGHWNSGLEFTGNSNTFASFRSSGYNGEASSNYTMRLQFKSGGDSNSNGVVLEGIANPSNSTDAANKGYVDNAIPKVYSSTNTGGYLTMATLPIYDGTVV